MAADGIRKKNTFRIHDIIYFTTNLHELFAIRKHRLKIAECIKLRMQCGSNLMAHHPDPSR